MQGCSLLLNTVEEILHNAVSQENKRYTDWEGRYKAVFVLR